MGQTFYDGCVVKFDGNKEPCVVYHVIDANEVIMEFGIGGMPIPMPHVYIEVIGWVPVQLLRKATQHHKNMFALDKKMFIEGRCN